MNISYFPSHHSNDNVKPIKNENMVSSYNHFVKFLNQDPHMQISLNESKFNSVKDAAAFYLEATKQLNPLDWEDKVDDLKGKIQEIRENNDPLNAHKETTWLLNDAISNLYQTTLAMNIEYEKNNKDTKKLSFYTKIFTNMQSTRLLRQKAKSKENIVEIGGINQTLLPEWYVKNYISPSPSSPSPPSSSSTDSSPASSIKRKITRTFSAK